jgi:lipopolysaccharide transport protein LptA
MKTILAGVACLLAIAIAAPVPAQKASPGSARPTKAKTQKGAAASTTPAKAKAQLPPGLAAGNDNNGQPIVTQIYSDEASFETEKRVGVFTGHVRVFDPRFNLQSDKLTVFIHKEEGEGLEKAIADGNVGVVRDKPDPKGGPPSKAVGLSDKAVYTSSDGNVELTGSPRVQMNLDSHVATSPDTVMILNQNGHLTTHGPSRTEIRQENANGKPGQPEKPGQPTPTPSPGASVSVSVTPSPAASPEKTP